MLPSTPWRPWRAASTSPSMTIGSPADSRSPSAKATISDTRLNPYSGKWNHHYDDAEFKGRRTTRLCVDYFFIELDRYLPEVKP